MYYGGTFEQYLSEFLPAFDADADAKLDTLTNKSIKYLFYRYNDYLVYKGFDPSPIIHTKLSTDELSLIYKVEKEKNYCKIKTTEDSEMIQDMSKNYKLLKRIRHELQSLKMLNFIYVP